MADVPADEDVAVIRTPEGYAIPADLLARWQKAYPSVDILAECQRAFEWDDAQPRKKKNVQAFLVNWLCRRQKESGPSLSVPMYEPAPTDTSLPALSEEQVKASRARFSQMLRDTVRRMPS